MEYTPAHIEAAKAVIRAKLALWDACAKLEDLTGFDAPPEGEALEDICSGLHPDEAGEFAAEYLDALKKENDAFQDRAFKHRGE